MEFFESIWSWIIANRNTIWAFLTSGSFITAVTSIVMLLKQNKTVVANTSASKELNTVLKENKKLNEEVKELKNTVEVQNNKITEMVDSNDKLLVKTNAMLEVLGLAYNGIRDESTRTSIQNILTNAKYSDTATRADLIRRIEQLKADGQARQDALTETVESVKKTLSADNKKPSEVIIRG